MKTASIAQRVADFLRRYPPFQYLSEDELFDLVGGGRVLFHENAEFVFEQGRRRKRFVYVIQQGVVHLLEQTGDGREHLRDVRGEGDLIGVGRFLGLSEHHYTARTQSDVILYGLPADRFWELVQRHPRASRYLGTYFSVATLSTPMETQDGRVDEPRLGRRPVDWMARPVERPLSASACPPSTPASEIAGLLAQRGDPAIAVVGPNGAPLGLVTRDILSDRVASGRVSGETPASALMVPILRAVAPPGLEAGGYLMKMLANETEYLIVTADGHADGAFLGLLTRRDLTRIEGAAPLGIIEDMARATCVTELSRLRGQGEAAVAAGLNGAESIRWLAPMAGAFNAAVLRRVVGLVEGALAREGVQSPALDHCWVFFGSAGRHELLTMHDLDHGLIYDRPAPGQVRPARAYFLELGRRVSAGLAACGFVTTAKGIVAGHPSACRSIDEWERAFSDWIGNPIESCVYRATSMFDLRPVHGDCRLVERLERHIHHEEDHSPSFVPLLVSDSMANLPPLTFFRGLVVDDDGAYTEELDLQRATLQPVVDIARALALDSGERAAPTLGRLRGLSPEDDAVAALIGETTAVFRNALYHRARVGLATGTDGSRVEPSRLTRMEQNLLKSGFRTVLRLMEYTGRHYGLRSRR